MVFLSGIKVNFKGEREKQEGQKERGRRRTLSPSPRLQRKKKRRIFNFLPIKT